MDKKSLSEHFKHSILGGVDSRETLSQQFQREILNGSAKKESVSQILFSTEVKHDKSSSYQDPKNIENYIPKYRLNARSWDDYVEALKLLSIKVDALERSKDGTWQSKLIDLISSNKLLTGIVLFLVALIAVLRLFT